MPSDLERIQSLASRGWMSPRQFATFIGVSYDIMYEMVSNHQIKAVPVGKHYRIYQDEIERFLREGNAEDEDPTNSPPDREYIGEG